MKKTKRIALFVLVVALIAAVVWFINRGIESTDDAMIDAHTIPISAKVPGYVTKLNVADNQLVKKSDLLVAIDPRDYQLRLDAANANFASAQVTAQNAITNAKRQIAIGKAAGTQRDIDNAVTAQSNAQTAVDSAKVQVAIAQKDLTDSQILAPEDGTVTMRTVEQGAYVMPGAQLFMLVGTERWVTANFKEVQITEMKPGQKVEIKVDAYPDLKLSGHIDSIQRGTGARFSAFPPENATGNFVKIVQRVPVKIVIDSEIPQGIVLGAGLSVRPTVHLEDKPAT